MYSSSRVGDFELAADECELAMAGKPTYSVSLPLPSLTTLFAALDFSDGII
jgi:hypothetical protein